MQVKEIMTRDVGIVRRDPPLTNATERMRAHDIGLLPVWDGDQLVEVLTDRDITVRAIANNLQPELVRCQNVMTSNVVFCFEDQDVTGVGSTRQDHKIRAFQS